MNDDTSDCDSQDPQDEQSPIDDLRLDKSPEAEMPTEKVNRFTSHQYQDKWPNWLIAIATWALVVVTTLYTYLAREQTILTREVLIATVDEMHLDQRPWLGYLRYVIQARENPAAWENREPRAEEEFRIRCYIQNTGKTPAFSVQLMDIVPKLVPIGDSPGEPEWSSSPPRLVIFPNDESWGHNSGILTLSGQQFSEYSSLEKEIFFWAKLCYCDVTGRRHWTKVEISHTFGSNEYSGRSASVSSGLGEANHPDCQN